MNVLLLNVTVFTVTNHSQEVGGMVDSTHNLDPWSPGLLLETYLPKNFTSNHNRANLNI